MNPHNHHHHMSLNINKSLRTRFTLRFIRALKKIQDQEKSCTKNGGVVGGYKKFHKVKVAADASMAAAVGPRRAWSRALLSRVRLSWCRRGLKDRKEGVACGLRCGARRAAHDDSQSQARELRSLVPGGEAMNMHNLLDETAHYIMCLTTQVKVMRNIVNYCSTS